MTNDFFVKKGSIVREIWGKGDTILFIFAGASAEFALNKAVDWLYYTGKLPSDPLGRLFSTVSYARTIVFSEKDTAHQAINKISAIHTGIESKRGMTIPDWAYRDVLFMLIDYSIRSFEILERKLTSKEKEEVFDVFFRLGNRMGINGLPKDFSEWKIMRQQHLITNLEVSSYTPNLYKQYRKHLGPVRYRLLVEAQTLVSPDHVKKILGYSKISWIIPLLRIYKISQKVKIDKLLKRMILPSKFKAEIADLDRAMK